MLYSICSMQYITTVIKRQILQEKIYILHIDYNFFPTNYCQAQRLERQQRAIGGPVKRKPTVAVLFLAVLTSNSNLLCPYHAQDLTSICTEANYSALTFTVRPTEASCTSTGTGAVIQYPIVPTLANTD